MNDVIPGVLEKDWSEIEKKLEIVKSFSKTVHVDIIDGKFADNTTFLNPQPFKKYSEDLFLELHMMVENPIEYIKPWADCGFKRFLGHIEKMPRQEEFISVAKQYGQVGLAIDGPTNLDSLNVPLVDLDCVLIMTINAGFSGQKFDERKLEKVKALRGRNQNLAIGVDGGVNDQTIALAKDAGANRFVSTSFLFSSQNPQETFKRLQTS